MRSPIRTAALLAGALPVLATAAPGARAAEGDRGCDDRALSDPRLREACSRATQRKCIRHGGTRVDDQCLTRVVEDLRAFEGILADHCGTLPARDRAKACSEAAWKGCLERFGDVPNRLTLQRCAQDLAATHDPCNDASYVEACTKAREAVGEVCRKTHPALAFDEAGREGVSKFLDDWSAAFKDRCSVWRAFALEWALCVDRKSERCPLDAAVREGCERCPEKWADHWEAQVQGLRRRLEDRLERLEVAARKKAWREASETAVELVRDLEHALAANARAPVPASMTEIERALAVARERGAFFHERAMADLRKVPCPPGHDRDGSLEARLVRLVVERLKTGPAHRYDVKSVRMNGAVYERQRVTEVHEQVDAYVCSRDLERKEEPACAWMEARFRRTRPFGKATEWQPWEVVEVGGPHDLFCDMVER